MITKKYSKTGRSCRVTFKHNPSEGTEKVLLLGEFNEWGADTTNELKKRKDGSFSLTLSLDAGKEYRFRYLLNDKNWENDEAADNYVWNSFGTQDAVLSLTAEKA